MSVKIYTNRNQRLLQHESQHEHTEHADCHYIRYDDRNSCYAHMSVWIPEGN